MIDIYSSEYAMNMYTAQIKTTTGIWAADCLVSHVPPLTFIWVSPTTNDA